MLTESDRPIFTAADLVAHKRRQGLLRAAPPQTVILVMQSALLERAKQTFPTESVAGFAGELVLLKPSGRVGVLGGFGLGSPVTAALTDELIAYGVHRFILIGLAGGLQPGMRVGDIVLSHRAWRGEGVSHHYLPAGQWAETKPGFAQAWGQVLLARGRPFQPGQSWTTDAPYRELRRDVLAQQQAGTLTVEMEAAGLLAVARHYGREAACGLVVADTLAHGRWRLEPDQRAADRSLRALLDTAIEFALGLP